MSDRRRAGFAKWAAWVASVRRRLAFDALDQSDKATCRRQSSLCPISHSMDSQSALRARGVVIGADSSIGPGTVSGRHHRKNKTVRQSSLRSGATEASREPIRTAVQYRRRTEPTSNERDRCPVICVRRAFLRMPYAGLSCSPNRWAMTAPNLDSASVARMVVYRSVPIGERLNR